MSFIQWLLLTAVIAAAFALGLVVFSLGTWVRITGGADAVGLSGYLLCVALIASAAVGFYYLLRP